MIWAPTLTSRAETGSSSTKKLGAKGEGPGDADALALAAGKFVWIAGQGRLVQAYLQPVCSSRGIFGRAPRSIVAMDAKGFGDDFRYRHTRIEGRERILEHRLHSPAECPQAGAGSAVDDFFTSEGDCA